MWNFPAIGVSDHKPYDSAGDSAARPRGMAIFQPSFHDLSIHHTIAIGKRRIAPPGRVQTASTASNAHHAHLRDNKNARDPKVNPKNRPSVYT